MVKKFHLVFATAALAAMPALSQPVKDGRIDMTLCFGGPMHMITATPSDRFGTYVVKGGTSAPDVTFDSMIVECAGTFEARSGTSQSRGYCVFQDAGGDKINGIDSLTPQTGYTWEYLGGTGKFAGITGSGRVERIGTLGPEPGALRGCRRFTGSYKLPAADSVATMGGPAR